MKNRKNLIVIVSLLAALALFAGCTTAAAAAPLAAAPTEAPAVLTLEEAKAIAYAHAGVAESGATDRSCDFDDGAYEIEFDHGGWEYDYRIAPDGTIVKSQKTPEPTRPAPQPAETLPAETKPAQTKQQKAESISIEEAKDIAYAHAGVKESEAHDRSRELDDGHYEIEFDHDGWEYEYAISRSGEILRSHKERDDDRPAKTAKPAETVPAEQKSAEKKSTEKKSTEKKSDQSAASGRISAEQALSIALNHAGVSDPRDKDVEWDDGRWEVSFESGRNEYEYKISASGSILRWEKEHDD